MAQRLADRVPHQRGPRDTDTRRCTLGFICSCMIFESTDCGVSVHLTLFM